MTARKTRASGAQRNTEPADRPQNASLITPPYWDRACAHLSATDPVMGQLIAKFGGVGLQSRSDPFLTLARSIVGQQISVKAAHAVWLRFEATMEHVTPSEVLRLSTQHMKAAGLSARKMEYLIDLAVHFEAGAIHPESWAAASDEEIIKELVSIRGIGRWTAEMFLIFHLLRPNVLPLDDVGLLKAIGLHYRSSQSVDRILARQLARSWDPWCSVATWYLWRSLDPVPVLY